MTKHKGPFVALSAAAGWTHFMDMHSGGGSKEKWEHIYIQAPEAEVKVIFYNRFSHSPDRVSCTCCGNDYSISFEKTLEQATAYQRNCAYGEKGYIEAPDTRYGKSPDRYQTITQYLKDPKAHFIFDKDIKDDERVGSVPKEGYVWQ